MTFFERPVTKMKDLFTPFCRKLAWHIKETGVGIFTLVDILTVVEDLVINKYLLRECCLAHAMLSKSPSAIFQFCQSLDSGGYFCALNSLPVALPNISQMDKREGSEA